MPADGPQSNNWEAGDWKELRTVWDGLVGEGRLTADPYQGVFRDNQISAQEAGYVFERWVTEALRLSAIDVIPAFSVTVRDGSKIREQIDGLAFLNSKAFLIESKFSKVDFGPIGRLHLLAAQRPPGTMGLLFAARGFTLPAVESVQYLLPMTVLLIGPDEIARAIELGDFQDVIRVKLREAIQFGVASFSLGPPQHGEE